MHNEWAEIQEGEYKSDLYRSWTLRTWWYCPCVEVKPESRKLRERYDRLTSTKQVLLLNREQENSSEIIWRWLKII